MVSDENGHAIDLTDVGREETLIEALLDGGVYPHTSNNIRLLNTHISWVILTGPYAYKIKKPLKLEFLDYSSLELRKHFCQEELRLNSRWAPDLYVDVMPICGSFERPTVGGTGEPIEYAVRMHQFPQSAQLDVQLEKDLLDDADMIALAEMIADQHEVSSVCDRLTVDDARRLVQHPMLENIQHLRSHIHWDELGGLAAWTGDSLEALWPVLLQRQDDGFIRECHGDLKLANLVRLPSGIAAFDCVEFNAELRNIDVISDVSFLVMDLIARERSDLAYVFINRYLERTGDYAGMAAFGLYFVYHALIRAKIAAIRSVERDDATDAECDLEVMNYYCSVARNWIEREQPLLIAMHGYSGAGKTWLSQQLLSRLPAIRIRSDIERKRRHGLAEKEASGAGVGTGIYEPRARADIYAELEAMASDLVRSGQHVIVDASFLQRGDRDRFRNLAEGLGARFIIVDVSAGQEELERRLEQRGGSVSEANADVLQYQYEHAEAITDAERGCTITVDTGATVDPEAVVEELQRRRDSH